MKRIDDDVRVRGDHSVESVSRNMHERMNTQGVHFHVDVEHACAAARAAFFTPEGTHERVVAAFLCEKRFTFAHRTATLLTFVRHVQEPLFSGLLSKRAERKSRDDAQIRVRSRKFVARGERFAMHHARVDEEHVEVESFFVGESAQERSGALHAGKDGGSWAKYLVHKA